MIFYLKEKIVICMDSLYKTKKVDIFERVFFNYQWQFEKPIAQAGHFCNQTLYHLRLMKVALVCTNVKCVVFIRETWNKTDIRKAIYWFENEIMNMVDEPSKNNDIKLTEGRVQIISEDEILELIVKVKPFTRLKDLINNKKEHLSDKFTPLVPNDLFALSDSEDSTEYEHEDDSPNVALLKFIESKTEYLRKAMNGTSKDVAFSERWKALKLLLSKKIEQFASEELSIIEINRKECVGLYFFTEELMFGPPTRECKKVHDSYPLKRKMKEPYPIKIKPKAMMKESWIEYFDSYIEYFDSWSHYKIWNAAGNELQTNEVKHIPWHTTYTVPRRVNGQSNFFNFVIKFFFQWSPLNLYSAPSQTSKIELFANNGF